MPSARVFLEREHPDSRELLDEDYIKGYENCEIDFCRAVVPDEPDEATSLSMKTLKNALKKRYLAKENENPLINWKMNAASLCGMTWTGMRHDHAIEKWSRYIENIAIDFFGSEIWRTRIKRFTGNPKAIWIGTGRFGTR